MACLLRVFVFSCFRGQLRVELPSLPAKPFDADWCLIPAMRLALVLSLGLTLGGVRGRQAPGAQPTPPIDVSPRLAEADALVEAGCFDCLRDALTKYQAIRVLRRCARGRDRPGHGRGGSRPPGCWPSASGNWG